MLKLSISFIFVIKGICNIVFHYNKNTSKKSYFLKPLIRANELKLELPLIIINNDFSIDLKNFKILFENLKGLYYSYFIESVPAPKKKNIDLLIDLMRENISIFILFFAFFVIIIYIKLLIVLIFNKKKTTETDKTIKTF